MHPKTTRQQNTQGNGNQQATSIRKHAPKTQTRVSMTTEYQERFLSPHCHMAAVSTSTKKDPYHPLRATGNDVTAFKTYYVTQKWIKNPPKTPQPPEPPKGQRRCSSAPHNFVHCGRNKVASKVEDYTSVYTNDFRAWKANKRQPFKLKDSLKVNRGLVVLNSASKDGRSQKGCAEVAAHSKAVPEVQEPQPFEKITSYRSDYVTHPVQPRVRRVKPVCQPNKGLSTKPAVSWSPKGSWDINQELFEQAAEFFQHFKTWSLKTKLPEQGKAKKSSSPADPKLLSTTHADYTAHKCQRTKTYLPTVQTCDNSKQPFQATTTMKEDYKAWNTPRRLPILPKRESDCPFLVSMDKSAESCNTNHKAFSLHPKLNETATINSSCNAAENPQCPAENGTISSFEYISTGTEESRRYWTTSLDKGVTWPNGDICEEPSEAHQIISCMASSRS